ncbi:MAG: hypothetical protein WD491_14815 [Balneolales bacterium]
MKIKYHIQCIIIVMACLFHANETKAQLTGGGEYQQPQEEEEASQQPQIESLFSRGTIWKFGWSNPKGSFGGIVETVTNYSDMFSSEASLGAQQGFSIGLDNLSSINVKQLFKNNIQAELGTKFGINYAQNRIDWSDAGGQWETDANYKPFRFLDIKAGLVGAISPLNDLVLDVFYNPMLSVVLPGEVDVHFTETTTNDEYEYNERFYAFDMETTEGNIPFGLRHGLGFHVRFKAIVFSVERTFGALDYNYEHVSSVNTFYDNYEERENYESEMSNNITLVTFGLAL